MIRLLIADDSAAVRRALKDAFLEAGDVAVAGEAADGHETLARARSGIYDAALVDFSMPGPCGAELIEALLSACPALRVVVFSFHDAGIYRERALAAGASLYLVKGRASNDELVGAVRRAAGRSSPRRDP